MDANYIINYIKTAKKKTNVKLYINLKNDIDFPNCQKFGSNLSLLKQSSGPSPIESKIPSPIEAFAPLT